MLSSYGTNELYGNQFFYGRAGFLKQVSIGSAITGDKAYLLLDYEAGRMYGFGDSERLPMDVNAGLVLKTVLGPLFLGGSLGDSAHRKWYFELGRLF
jgi:NTE family protein